MAFSGFRIFSRFLYLVVFGIIFLTTVVHLDLHLLVVIQIGTALNIAVVRCVGFDDFCCACSSGDRVLGAGVSSHHIEPGVW